jgi:hypothetical protein
MRFRICQIRMFLGLLNPDPDALVRGMDPDLGPAPDLAPYLAPDPDSSIIKQK